MRRRTLTRCFLCQKGGPRRRYPFGFVNDRGRFIAVCLRCHTRLRRADVKLVACARPPPLVTDVFPSPSANVAALFKVRHA